MLAVIWSEEQDKWLAECAKLDSEFEIPASSKTALGRHGKARLPGVLLAW